MPLTDAAYIAGLETELAQVKDTDPGRVRLIRAELHRMRHPAPGRKSTDFAVKPPRETR